MIGVFLDTETNGLNPQVHKILEIALKIVDLATGELKETFQTVLLQTAETWEKSDEESLKINGFQFKDLEKGMALPQVSQMIIDLFSLTHVKRKKAVFICQNPSFDRAFFSQIVDPDTQELLSWPYHWLDLASMHWATAMLKAKTRNGPFPWDIGLSKDAIATHYKLPPEATPHRAMNGVNHLLLCYEALIGFPLK